ncbi:MAG: phosphatidate cytidylyltransferase [Acidobacteriaceae bacterium]|nr:phosphatidate cytidylyltransferase [Acidobacteriaceae bacterium]
MQRLITAILLIAVALYLIFLAPSPIFMGAALCMGVLCYYEFSTLVARYGIQKPGILGFIVGLLVLLRPEFTLLGVVLSLGAVLTLSLRRDDLRAILPQVACALFGAFYAFAPWRFAIDLRHASIHLLFFALAINWIGDTAAYYVGRRFGRHRLAPVVSPKKSWEGGAASVVTASVFGLLYLGNFMQELAPWEIALMAVLGNIAGQFGDLVESALKRGAGVKDSGSMLPGHGGLLDRVDSSLFAVPVVYAIYLVHLVTRD